MSALDSQAQAELRFPWESAPAAGQVREVADGVLWLRMPLPFGLDHINLYLLRHEHGWVVVDTGLATDASRDVWERVFVEVLEGRPILALVATHFHYDHTGLLGWLADRFHCPVYMTQGEFQSMFVTPPQGDDPGWEFRQFYQRAGLDAAQIESLLPVVRASHYQIQQPHSYRRLREGSVLTIGERRWRVVIGSGHSPEHACLYSEDDRLLISGDQVLPRITSSVCVGVTEPDANPLGEWLESLRRLRVLPADVLVLPAHERPFVGLHERLLQLLKHHERHLENLVGNLRGAMTAAELRPLLFPRIKGPFDLLMSLGETLAHINFLVEEGSLVREPDGDACRYRLRDAEVPSQGEPEAIHV
ncbi:Hydroxyacylglutathione hydrolase [compost metagenome]